ncbi:MAG: DNA topoisomerase IB [Bacteroidia bacterium]
MELEDPELFAQSAGLVYVSDTWPGYTRVRKGKGFVYLDEKDNKVVDPKVLDRIHKIVIPPAWEKVWICKKKNGHLQVTGYDQKGRKQYLYQEKWMDLRNKTKYDEMYEFGRALPKIRSTLEEHLKFNKLSREKVLAGVVSLLDESMVRVGNSFYAKENESFGLTTIRSKHAKINGTKVELEFKGKSGVQHYIKITDKRLTKIIKECNELPGYEIFKYIDEEGNIQDVESGHVNEYLREISGKYFTAKYFRTWGGSIEALKAYVEQQQQDDFDKRKKKLTQVVKCVSIKLNNTISICRDYYIHSKVIDFILEEKPIEIKEITENREAGLSEIENFFLKLIKPKAEEVKKVVETVAVKK